MISLDYAARQMTGAWKMAFGAENWRRSLDRSLEDVFASFQSIIFVAPLTLFFTFIAIGAADKGGALADTVYGKSSAPVLVFVEFLTLAFDWAASIAVLVVVARAFGGGREAAELIIGYNWTQPILAALRLPAMAIYAAGDAQPLSQAVELATLGLMIALVWGVVRRGLGAGFGVSAAVVAALLVCVGLADLAVASIAHAIISPQS